MKRQEENSINPNAVKNDIISHFKQINFKKSTISSVINCINSGQDITRKLCSGSKAVGLDAKNEKKDCFISLWQN